MSNYGLDFQEPKLEEKIEEARVEWKKARKYFDIVSDPDLVDHAIYLLGAAERKYEYLLKVKQEEREEA
ncbi:MAG: DUF2508 family protein [Bacillota bacterium]